jgi:hypothetical protein
MPARRREWILRRIADDGPREAGVRSGRQAGGCEKLLLAHDATRDRTAASARARRIGEITR